MNDGESRRFRGRVREAVGRPDDPPEVDDPQEHRQEYRQDDRELDQALAALTG
jgi:hypothetical protein